MSLAAPIYTEECQRCGETHFSPSVEVFEMTGDIVCHDCAEEHSGDVQFGDA